MILKKYTTFTLGMLALFMGSSCQPDEVGEGNGLTDTQVDAAFTVANVEGEPNRFVLEATGDNVLVNRWNVGDGYYTGGDAENLFLPDAGTYQVSHIAVGRGGATHTSSQEIVVAQSDPAAGNLVLGGKFESAEDISQWTVLQISESGANWTFNDGYATLTSSGYNQQGIYQPITVEANKEYTIDLRAFGSAAVNTWFEVYVSPTAPVQNEDYSADGRRIGLSTWDGCATGEYDGRLSQIGCVGSGNTVSFDEAGTVYLVIKGGGESTGSTGISITNIEMRGSSN